MSAVFKHSTSTQISGSWPFFSFTPRASTVWKIWQIGAWKMSFNFNANNSTGEYCGQFFLEVSQNTIAEFQLANTYTDMRFPSIIIPFGDGITFSGSQQVRVRVVPFDLGIFTSTMIGEE
jgi:hypothetical protein